MPSENHYNKIRNQLDPSLEKLISQIMQKKELKNTISEYLSKKNIKNKSGNLLCIAQNLY